MNEITKLYKNANIEKKTYCDYNCGIRKGDFECTCNCSHYEDNDLYYPNFNDKKQLSLIKWLILNDFVDKLNMTYRPLELMWVFQIYNVIEFANEKRVCRMGADMTFEKGLASLINTIWQDLTAAEKEQIKEILK